MKFSLILGTLNRHEEIKLCLESISQQAFKDYEIIIIDQSQNELTEKVVASFDFEHLKYRRVNFKGLSKARNEALKIAEGDYFCLIDDDAFYPDNYLQVIDSISEENSGKCIFTGYMWNSITNSSFVNYSKLKNGNTLTVREIARYCPSPAITFPMDLREKIGFFDDNFGVGAVYGACEETDYVLRALKSGYSVIYSEDIKVVHPHEKLRGSSYIKLDPIKIKSYAVGFGALARKHSNNFRLKLYYMESLIKDLLKIILKSPVYKNEFIGHVEGYFQYKSLDSTN